MSFSSFNIAGIDFLWPWFLLCLPLPWLIYRFLPAAEQSNPALFLPTFDHVHTDPGLQQSNPSRWRFVWLSLIWLATVLAASRPCFMGEPISLPPTGRDLLLAVDISTSMEAEDMLINNQQSQRITAVKKVVGDFIEQRQGDRLGLILFGSHAYLDVPLTFDVNTVQQQLDEAQLGFAGGGTAIGDAIAMGIKKLREHPQESRVLILLTDGQNTSGEMDPKQAADLAASADIKIHTVGIGADSMIIKGLLFNQRVNPSADLDETTLQYIADTTDGRYFRARNPEELSNIYKTIDELEPVEQDQERFRPRSELFYWPLAFALFASLLWPLYISLQKALFYIHNKISNTSEKAGAGYAE